MRVHRVFLVLCCAGVALFVMAATEAVRGQDVVTQAPTGFDNQTNGFITQAKFDEDKAVFEERDTIAKGLGPVYNAQSCAECHQNPVTGGISQVTEMRAGHLDSAGNFVDAPGGSLIHDRAIDAAIQEYVPYGEKIRALRASTNTLGAGFVEAISAQTLIDIANGQPARSGGLIGPGDIIWVPVPEAPGSVSVGRFGWKNQHASLLGFSGDAYLNEIGITNRLFPLENTSLGEMIAAYDTVPDPEDTDNDIDRFAEFMRATKAPPRDAALAVTADARAGEALFTQIGCNICHVSSIQTAPTGTTLNGGTFTVPPALGDKIIHPYSDFLPHDVGTGDNIVQNGETAIRDHVRTVPLWGLRTHSRHMHDGASLTLRDAIVRHGGEAAYVTANYRALTAIQKEQILAFLDSL